MSTVEPQVLMVAAECRGLAKVGGLADVVRDLSAALHRRGVNVSVALPLYGRVIRAPDPVRYLRVAFGRREDWPVGVSRTELDGVPFFLLQNEAFFDGDYGEIYIDSDRRGRGPFEDDAQRFAFFSAAVLELLRSEAELAGVTALHAHDWHTGMLLLLLARDARNAPLARRLQTLFTIHNLDYQGVRPFDLEGATEFASFASWFPELYEQLGESSALDDIEDPRSRVPCLNPMRAGINLADCVNTVSPNYADEIRMPDDPSRNFVGGRGLERDLSRLGPRLRGILNGLDYALYDPNKLHPPFDAGMADWSGARAVHKQRLLSAIPAHLRDVVGGANTPLPNPDRLLEKAGGFQPGEWQDKLIVVSVTRAVRQKVSLLLEPMADGRPVFDHLLDQDILLLMLGTGELAQELGEINSRRNGFFMPAFDPSLAESLYAGGDLFLMPSDFEPCGISQMIAMRYGCLPLVSDVGGLTNTVRHGQTGFLFAGATREEARHALVEIMGQIQKTFEQSRKLWSEMQLAAMHERFEWSTAADQYIELYRG